METAAQWVREALGRGTYVRAIEVGNGEVDSLVKPMEWQLQRLAAQIQADPRLADGFNFIGFSQGSLLCRAFVQRYDAPRVRVLVSWVGPQAGQFGVPAWEPLLKRLNHITSAMWYTPALQASVAFANYWRDPMRLHLYKAHSAFLADINNERDVYNTTYAARLRRLDHFVLLYSSQDVIIQPALSSWFGFFRDNSTHELVPLARTRLYTEDRLGLRHLDRAGRLHFARCACPHRAVPTGRCKIEAFDAATRDFLRPERATAALLRWLRLHARPPRPPAAARRRSGKQAADAPGRRMAEGEEGDTEESRLRAELQRETARADALERELQKLRGGGGGGRGGSKRSRAVAADAWRAAMRHARAR